MAFAGPAVTLHARYLLLATARAALGAGWVFDVSQPPFTRSEMIRDGFDCSRKHIKPHAFTGLYGVYVPLPQETFPGLSPQHSQFSVLHCEGFSESETWPLLPPCG